MTRDGGISTERYARAIERRWSRHAERSVVLSPRDWALVSRWYTAGIPLEIVYECLEAGAARRPGPPNLAYVASAVEEAWSVVCRGRLDSAFAPADE